MLDSISLSILAGTVLSAALIGSALLGWLGDIKRVGSATSARETRRAAGRQAVHRTSGSRPQPRGATRSASQEQEDRIRAAYFAKEKKAREARERQRRQDRTRQRSRQAAGAAAGPPPPPPPAPSEKEAHYRATLDLTGDITPERLRAAYRLLIAAYHPDRVATLGVKLQKLAEEETKRINEAYSFFRRRL